MALLDVILPKSYQDGDILYEEDLDLWRLKSEEAFSLINLNFTQLVKDTFSAGYQLDNDGNPNLPLSIEDRLNKIEGGDANLFGTTSDTWTVNTDGNSGTLDTVNLTANQTYNFPDQSGEFLLVEGIQPVTGAKTFDPLVLKLAGAGAGVASLQYANSATDYSHTVPDVGLDADFLMANGPQSVLGAKTFDPLVLKLAGAGAGVASLQYANSATDYSHTVPDVGLDADFVMTEGNQDISGNKTFFDDLIIDALGSLIANGPVTFNNSINFIGTIVAQNALAIDLFATGNRIDLDTDNDTSLRCDADDNIVFELGGADLIEFNSNGEVLLPEVNPPTSKYLSRSSGAKAWGSISDPDILSPEFGVSSMFKNAIGDYTISWDHTFTFGQYVVITSDTDLQNVRVSQINSTFCKITTYNWGGAPDLAGGAQFAAFGRQF
jgi:hypothetical protein